jgi:hypothetical protein
LQHLCEIFDQVLRIFEPDRKPKYTVTRHLTIFVEFLTLETIG